jgi:hypothetical protein
MATTPKHISIVINGRTFTIGDLGPAADMRIDKAMQSILDQGLLGEQYKGQPWYQVFEIDVEAESHPDDEDVLCYSLFKKYDDYLKECANAHPDGKLSDEERDTLQVLRNNWRMAEKLKKA